MATPVQNGPEFGELVREWRRRRGVSQMRLALDADISPRHLSFVETGRAQASRNVVLRLAEQLQVPLRQRNALLLAAGYAPAYAERPLEHPDFTRVRQLVEGLLRAHEPYPALAIDRMWNIVAANRAVGAIVAGVAPALMAPPLNAMRLALHPDGLAPHIANFGEWRAHLLDRLRRDIDVAADSRLIALYDELSGYPAPPGSATRVANGELRVAIPMRLVTPSGMMSFISTTMVFGTPLDITLSELALETFLPADAATETMLRALTEGWNRATPNDDAAARRSEGAHATAAIAE